MPVGAAIGAVGSLGAAGLGYAASKSASSAQVGLGQQSLANQQAMFGAAQGALDPFIKSGQSVLPTLQKLLTPGADQTATLSQLPGFQFQSNWGNMAATNALAARGLGGSSGSVGKALSDYNQGLAGTSFGNLTGMLQTFANMGSSAGGALAGNATQTGANMGSTFTGIGNSMAAGTLGGANALAGGLTGGANSISNAYIMSKLLGSGGFGGGGSGGGGLYDTSKAAYAGAE